MLKRKLLKREYFPPIAITIFAIVFKRRFGDLLTTIFVKPLLSSLDRSTIATDFIFLCLAAYVFFIFVDKAIRRTRLSRILILWSVAISFLYLWYLFPLDKWYVFTSFASPFIAHFRLADILLSPVAGIVIYFLSAFVVKRFDHKKDEMDGVFGFATDSPIILDEKNDELDRYAHIVDLRRRILATESSKSSFAIAIIGKWGSGKSTFIQTLEVLFKKDSQSVIQMRFNPWATHQAESVSRVFFQDLATRLSEFDDTLKSKIISYSMEILDVFDSGVSSVVSKLLRPFNEDKELADRYQEINESIRRMDRKIIVYIDDLYRLNKDVVVEVLKIIRNTGNFGNMFFIVPFDKVYVLDSIKSALNSEMTNYLEKIFQLEYYLPYYPDKTIFKQKLIKELRRFLSADDQRLADNILNPPAVSTDLKLERLPPVEDYIRSIRDIKRFVNVFCLSYGKIKGDIYLPDYIGICLLRLKYPEVCHLLYNDRREYLLDGNAEIWVKKENQVYALRLPEKPSEIKIENSYLYIHLYADPGRYGISEIEVCAVVELVNAIFPMLGERPPIQRKRNLDRHYLSVIHWEFFDRYFDFEMRGRLSEEEFRLAMAQPIDRLKQTILGWNDAGWVTNDLNIKLENLRHFESKLDFEKAIHAIVFFASLPVKQNPYFFNRFNLQILYGQLGGNVGPYNLVVTKLYGGNIDEFKVFFTNLYQKAERWKFKLYFVNYLLKEQYTSFPLSPDELQDLMAEDFIEKAKSYGSVDLDIREFYSVAMTNFSEPNAQILIPTGKGIQMTTAFRELIEANVEPFLPLNIFRDGRTDLHQLGQWANVIFGSDANFVEFLNRKLKETPSPSIKEYLRFCAEFKANPASLAGFEFLALEVR